MRTIRPSRRSLGAVLAVALLAGCAGASSSGDPTAFEARICGALLSLKGNQDDIIVITRSETATVEDARAAIRRMQDRTRSAVEGMREAAGQWAPGHDFATRLADAEGGLLPIIDTFDKLASTGDVSLWTKATNDYTTWYGATRTVVDAAPGEFERLGIDCQTA